MRELSAKLTEGEILSTDGDLESVKNLYKTKAHSFFSRLCALLFDMCSF